MKICNCVPFLLLACWFMAITGPWSMGIRCNQVIAFAQRARRACGATLNVVVVLAAAGSADADAVAGGAVPVAGEGLVGG